MVDGAFARESKATARARRVGVIDVGSNSVRLVVFDGLHRRPIPVFNERVMCGLGRGLKATGRLDKEGVAGALAALGRFARLSQAMELASLDVLATAAVREAEDGPDFVAQVRQHCGLEVRVLSGKEEARLAALGVISATPEADGAMGDLGGGSLELVALDLGGLGAQATLPLGLLRLQELAGEDPSRLRGVIDESLAAARWLRETRGRPLYAVGGGWRALARADMARTGYPLHIIHGYALSPERAAELAKSVAGMDRRVLERLPGVPRRRFDLLPLAALVLARLLKVARPGRVVFSAHGLREGWLYARLPDEARRQDPLLEACRELASREGRFSEHGEELAAWTAPLLPDEGREGARLRLAACLLSELAWRAHPDHRADEALLTILWAPFVAVDHPQRAFLALAVHARYTGGGESAAVAQTAKLIDAEGAERARLLGLALRLGHTITGGAPGVLGKFSLHLPEGELVLALSRRDQALMGEAVERRLDALAHALGRVPALRVST